MSKHTPGKWKHEIHDADFRGTGLIWAQDPDWEDGKYTSPNVKIVARVHYADDGRRKWDGAQGDEFEANCRLVEAAPELFELAKNVLEYVVTLGGEESDPEVHIARALNRVISKIEGES